MARARLNLDVLRAAASFFLTRQISSLSPSPALLFGPSRQGDYFKCLQYISSPATGWPGSIPFSSPTHPPVDRSSASSASTPNNPMILICWSKSLRRTKASQISQFMSCTRPSHPSPTRSLLSRASAQSLSTAISRVMLSYARSVLRCAYSAYTSRRESGPALGPRVRSKNFSFVSLRRSRNCILWNFSLTEKTYMLQAPSLRHLYPRLHSTPACAHFSWAVSWESRCSTPYNTSSLHLTACFPP